MERRNILSLILYTSAKIFFYKANKQKAPLFFNFETLCGFFFLIVVSFIFTFLYFSYADIKKGVYSQVTLCGGGFRIQAEGEARLGF